MRSNPSEILSIAMHTKLTRFFENSQNSSVGKKGPSTVEKELGQNATPEDPLIISCALLEIENHIKQYGKSLEDFPELPAIHYDLLDCNRQTQLFIEETTFLQDKLQQILEGVSLLNDKQRAIYDAMLAG
ncbi:18670_t:CDS:2 [Dentiscutata erythropus]|uniref:18670_t:CDS:1 n=1 Tax=Dentiscutata erythropus TaxID=1348616 RepID=A0A9N8ZMV4_9GLOM|nr:18670_t:CDS:2 [Dentiscutata erythropus]